MRFLDAVPIDINNLSPLKSNELIPKMRPCLEGSYMFQTMIFGIYVRCVCSSIGGQW